MIACITPTLSSKRLRYYERLIASWKRQTVETLLIVVDSDETDFFAFPNIIYVAKSELHTGGKRAQACEIARAFSCDAIVHMDDDDDYEKEYVATMADALERGARIAKPLLHRSNHLGELWRWDMNQRAHIQLRPGVIAREMPTFMPASLHYQHRMSWGYALAYLADIEKQNGWHNVPVKEDTRFLCEHAPMVEFIDNRFPLATHNVLHSTFYATSP